MPDRGDSVRIHYTGRLEDGTVFDSSEGKEPLEFVVGASQVIPGLDQAILKMDEGESRTVTVEPDDAYGRRQTELVREVPRSQIPDGIEEGSALQAHVDGRETVVWVTELGAEKAVVDANHPLAGKALVFDVELVSISPPG